MPDDALQAAVTQIRSYGSVAVLGAGISAARFPLTAQLPPLLWHAIDSDPHVRSALASDLQRPGDTAKEVIGTDPSGLTAAWQMVEAQPEIRSEFQRAFARLDLDRDPTPAHFAVARLIRAGLIEFVISFNWDTLLERAYEQLYGAALLGYDAVLAKPHGDAARPEQEWVLPHESGSVPPPVLERMAAMQSERPRILLVVGYSGSDAAVVETLLRPAEGRWPVVRVGPDATAPGSITGSADDVLPALADRLGAPTGLVGWRWVNFSRGRDLRAALLGYRLGPQDVLSCPTLAGAQRVTERLASTGFAAIHGDSGAGKSITAFQAAYERSRDGWSVVELSQPGVASSEIVRTFAGLRGPILAVVDDAQALSAEVRRDFERATSSDHAVILAATEMTPGQEQVRLSAAEAVSTLASFCLHNRNIVEPLVSSVDDRVGPGLMQESFERRVGVASGADYPWQFMYVLSGGDRRIVDAIANLASEDDGDLLFGILAAAQLTSVDAGISTEALADHARTLGRDENWLATNLARLGGDRLLLERGGRLRTPHLRSAERGLLELCRTRSRPIWPQLIAFMRSRLLDDDEPLQGKLWLLRAVDQLDVLRYAHRNLILDEAVAEVLIRSCLAAPAGRERNIGAYLLWEVWWWRAMTARMAEEVASTLPGWLRETTSADVYGLAWLLGGLRSGFEELHGEVSTKVSPEAVAERLTDYGTADAGEDWGRLIGELAHARGIDSAEWGQKFEAAVDVDRIAAQVSEARPESSLRGPIELVHNLVWLAPRLAAAVVRATTPALARRLETDIAGASRDLVPWAFGVFSIVGEHGPESSDEPDIEAVRSAIQDLLAATDWPEAGAGIAKSELSHLDQLNLLTWSVHHLSPRAFDELASGVSLDDLDQVTAGHWGDFALIHELVLSLSHGANYEPARTWVLRHAKEIEHLPTTVIPIAPEVVVGMLTKGLAVRLDVQGGLRWDWCARALEALRRLSSAAAVEVARSSNEVITDGLELRQPNMTEGLVDFVAEMDAIDPGLLLTCIERLEPATARANWSARIAGSDEERSAALVLMRRAQNATSEMGRVAIDLLDRANAGEQIES